MEQSNVISTLRKLKVAAEYSVLMTRLNYLNKICSNSEEFDKEKLNEHYCNLNDIYGVDYLEFSTVEDSHTLTVYKKSEENADVFQMLLYISRYSQLNSIPDNIDQEKFDELKQYNYISGIWYDEYYEMICEQLNDIEYNNKEIIEALQNNSLNYFSMFHRQQ